MKTAKQYFIDYMNIDMKHSTVQKMSDYTKQITVKEFFEILECAIEKEGEEEWLEFEENKKLFSKAAKNNCLCKFDDGTVCRFNDSQPFAILTHFKPTQLK